MKHPYSHFLALTLLASSTSLDLRAQCTIQANAAEGISLTTADGQDNRSAIAYNTTAHLYYSVDAGSSGYPVETYDDAGTLVDTRPQGYDYRGAWWNVNTAQFEGNGYASSGIYVHTLDISTSYPTGVGSIVLACAQPDAQSIGTYDPDADEILYYYSGTIYRYARATGIALGSYTITGLPVPTTSLNDNTVSFTGCLGHEIGLYDYVDKQFLYVNKATGAYASFSQLPLSAPARTSFGVSYANGKVWLFSQPLWHSYDVLHVSTEGIAAQDLEPVMEVLPNPATDRVQVNSNVPLQRLDLLNAQGQVVLSRTDHRNFTMQMDLVGVAAGTYVLSITSDKGMVNKQLIKLDR